MSIAERDIRPSAVAAKGTGRGHRMRSLRAAAVSRRFSQPSAANGTGPGAAATAETTERHLLVRGRHYARHASQIDALRQQGLLTEAVELALECVEAAELDSLASAGAAPAPPPAQITWQAAQVFRSLGRYDAEIAVLERWLLQVPDAEKSKDHCVRQIRWRLAHATELRRRQLWHLL
ncbi:hypothetical protein KIH31_09425 [Paenarthrobacter sp. DKR-5]|uniref:hypothetical protein n=1 Tax=Paenarthrobacter sp. DKR-5 TaxID=2835535 RepID=UPI001BDC85A4|nr:hypothetical protein [Paenarthrobacter sp. DKR-5]MBT1002825.1 hypothetical protein [Paenarthrobacter sp. DKR-5]